MPAARAGCFATPSWYSRFYILPIAVLIIYSFNGAGVGGFPPRNLTFDWYRTLFADGAIWESVGNSLLVAAAAVAIALALGIPAALALDRAQFPGKALFRRLVLLPLILPGIITGLSLLMLVNEAKIKLSLLTIVLGHGTALISVATPPRSSPACKNWTGPRKKPLSIWARTTGRPSCA